MKVILTNFASNPGFFDVLQKDMVKQLGSMPLVWAKNTINNVVENQVKKKGLKPQGYGNPSTRSEAMKIALGKELV